jgi:hypothetical protein
LICFLFKYEYETLKPVQVTIRWGLGDWDRKQNNRKDEPIWGRINHTHTHTHTHRKRQRKREKERNVTKKPLV